MKNRIAFIAGKYRGKTDNEVYENIQKARKVAIKYWKLGFAVICPQMNSAFMSGVCDEDVFLKGYLALIRLSEVVVMMKGWEGSEGAIQERLEAMKYGINIIYE